MFGSLRLQRFSTILVAAFLLPCFAEESRADVLAEYLFWDSLGNTVGEGLQAHADYRAERKLWKDKIAAAKAKSERCGDCASAEAELRKWQGVENRFQDFAGGLAQSVGMPPLVAKWLDIDLPPTSGRGPKWTRKIVRGAWVDDLPEVYQRAVDKQLACLRDYQAGDHGPSDLGLDTANLPGAQCYETSKLYRYIAAKDYQAFDREKSVQKARAAGKIIPEYIDQGPTSTVYYGQVRDDFVPRLPPSDVILSKLREEQAIEVEYIMLKTGAGQLAGLGFEEFFWIHVAPQSRCFSSNGPQTEIERRVCDDLDTMRRKPLTLLCYYTRQGGTETITQEGAFIITRDGAAMYWYAERPDAADPARLLARSASHPVLQIGDPRTDCPTTKREANRVDTEYSVRIARLMSQTPQISASVTLPTARDARAKRKLAAFPIEGQYTTTVFNNYTTVRQSSCTIKNVSDNQFEIICKDRKGQYGGTGIIEGGKFIVDFGDTTIAFIPAGNMLTGMGGRVQLDMIRIGDIEEVVASGENDATARAEPAAAPRESQDAVPKMLSREEAEAKARKQADQAAIKQREEAQAKARKQAEQVAKKQREKLNDADIVGLRLGMTLADAETIVRNRLDVATIVEGKPATTLQPFQDFRGFHNREQSESIVLFKESADSDKLIAVVRVAALPAGFDPEKIETRLKEKYGQNVKRTIRNNGNYYGVWSASENLKRCSVTSYWRFNLTGLKVVQRSERQRPSFMLLKLLRGPLATAGTWDGCEPTVVYEILGSKIIGFKINVILYNLAMYAPYLLEPSKSVGPGGTKSSKIDF